MKITLLFFTILFFDLLIAQTTIIPDPNFEQELINLGYDVGLDGQVLTANINSIDTLDVRFKNIADLTGIQDFSSLTYLDCRVTQITSLDVTQNTSLERLICYSNQITSLDVTQNTSLNYIRCSNINLTSLDISQNPLLTHLDCSDNQLTNLDISQNTLLTFIDCRLNQITSLDITQNTVLTDVQFSANQLTTLNVTQNALLTSLACDNNQLTNLNITQNIALSDLACYANPLTSLNVTQNTSLTSLDCGTTSITSLNLSQNTNLTSLDCVGNSLLACLNVKNTNNSNLNFFLASSCPNLTCIEVDNVAFSAANWTVTNFSIDAGVSFNTNCGTPCIVGINEHRLSELNIYPNPTTGNITIDLGKVKQGIKTTLTNSLGQVVLTQNYGTTDILNINIDAPTGIYFLQIETYDGESKNIKFLKK